MRNNSAVRWGKALPLLLALWAFVIRCSTACGILHAKPETEGDSSSPSGFACLLNPRNSRCSEALAASPSSDAVSAIDFFELGDSFQMRKSIRVKCLPELLCRAFRCVVWVSSMRSWLNVFGEKLSVVEHTSKVFMRQMQCCCILAVKFQRRRNIFTGQLWENPQQYRRMSCRKQFAVKYLQR